MTGAELLAQVREALWDTSNALVPGTLEQSRGEALAALDGCILLTREEAEKLRVYLHEPAVHTEAEYDAWVALLTPDEPLTDIEEEQ